MITVAQGIMKVSILVGMVACNLLYGGVAVAGPVNATPGERTLKNLIMTAMEPVGTTLYVYGGGWDYDDIGSGPESMYLGVPPQWVGFFMEQDVNYNYRYVPGTDNKVENPDNSYYPFQHKNEYNYAGADCSGYLGWVIFNTMTSRENLAGGNYNTLGYVVSSTRFAQNLAENYGYGVFSKDRNQTLKCGDIVSISGHVWMCLGVCEDGSVLILHSSPTPSRTGELGGGIQLTALNSGETGTDCEAYRLADQYMSQYYPGWYARYEVQVKPYASYMAIDKKENAGIFSFTISEGGLTDPDGYRDMTPQEILKDIFHE